MAGATDWLVFSLRVRLALGAAFFFVASVLCWSSSVLANDGPVGSTTDVSLNSSSSSNGARAAAAGMLLLVSSAAVAAPAAVILAVPILTSSGAAD